MTLARNAADQERLIELVKVALASLDADQPVDVQALCTDAPHLAVPLAEVLGLHDQIGALQAEALREDPLQGLVLAGRYRLQDCLGRGAMGVVYAAADEQLQRSVAVKILDVRLFRDPEAERRFQREAEALAVLQHPNVVAVFDRGRSPEGIHFLVMERLHGGTLAALLERIADGGDRFAALAEFTGAPVADAVWPRAVAGIGRGLAQGLAAAHAHGLVHRDVKPSNVFLAAPGRAVLLDFGIAARADDQRLTATQTTLGTPWYMAPEQVRTGGAAVALPTLDVYGLGATLFHLLAGRPPFQGDAAQVLATLQTQDAPLLRDVCDAPRDFAAIVDRCLQRVPTQRYPTAAELDADLGAFLDHRPVTARPLGPLARRWRRWRRTPARLVAVVGALVITVVLAIAAPFVWEQRARERVRAKAELLATLPSVLAVEGWPGERLVEALAAEHRTGVELLDRLLVLDPDDDALRLFRACLHLDLGASAVAAADFAVIAARNERPYLRELARRYAAVDATARGAGAIDLSGLPSPDGAVECYVAGFHELRNSDVDGFAQRADDLLAKAVPDYLPARDLRLLSMAALAERSRGDAQQRLLRAVYDESIRLEVVYGGATARTCAMRGVALLLQQRYRDAVEPLERSLALRPDRHGPHHNLGLCWLSLGDLDRAEHHLRDALRVRPFAWNTRHTLARLKRDRGDFAGARELAAGLETTGKRGEAWKQPDLLASIDVAEAMAVRAADPERARALAAAAVAAYDVSLAAARRPDVAMRRGIAVVLTRERVEGAAVEFAGLLLEDPDQAWHLANLAFLLPRDGLSAEATAWVGAILRKLAWQRAAGEETFRARMLVEIDEGLRPFRKPR
ncbi:MAG: protein kinase [Planctomycetes bacterium]|nr:protein kinase [Planctomycetota bacterium]